MRRIGGLVPEQIPVRPGVLPAAVDVIRPFPAGERDRAVRMRRLDLFHHTGDRAVAESGILAALQNDGAETEIVSVTCGRQDPVFAQTVALRFGIPGADAAVITVVAAVTGKLDQTAEIDLVPEMPGADGESAAGGFGLQSGRLRPDQFRPEFTRQRVFRLETVQQSIRLPEGSVRVVSVHNILSGPAGPFPSARSS